MARKPSAQAAKQVTVSAAVPAVLERLAKLSGAGAAPERIIRETEACIADWKTEGLGAGDLAERIEELRNDLEGGLESAIEQAADVSRDDKAGTRAAVRVVDGLRGALGVVDAVLTT